MDGFNVWDWDATTNGFGTTIDASSSSFAPTTTTLIPTSPTIPINNGQIVDGVDDWGLHAMVNDFSPNTTTSSSSFAPASTTTFNSSTTTDQTIPINNSQMLGDVTDWGLHKTIDDLYPSFAASSSSFSFSFSSSTFSATTAMPTTIPVTSAAMPIPGGNYNQQHPMNITNIKQMLQNSNYPVNNIPKIQNPPVSNNNMQILSLPGHGKIPQPSKYHHQLSQQQQQQRYQPPPQRNHLHINQQSIRVSEHANARAQITTKQSKIKTKRVYKMPVQGLNTDKLSWKKYGAKIVDGSRYPRVYYKCTFTNDCKVRRKVELNQSDPNTLIVTYSGDHNHLPPVSGNLFATGGNSNNNNQDFTNHDESNHPTFSKAISPADILSFGNKKTQKNKKVNNKDDDIFGGLEDFIPL
ncbi:hypothetical protein L6452_33239 [Arctium lappa]|uniref:Uncharacterized protein n=1 Tax=Arctium lappa TaxID=4217 RepID=A0ACB8Z5X6_ARCLA|nr:hypothetical protein L6452_33239 [Arctium lappa]